MCKLQPSLSDRVQSRYLTWESSTRTGPEMHKLHDYWEAAAGGSVSSVKGLFM